tara:strand:+ start:2123 stop:3919 length:1797 start_codon:yes stop_codon:yes gene_type:complete
MKVEVHHKDFEELILKFDIPNFKEFLYDFRTSRYNYIEDIDNKIISSDISNYTEILNNLNELKKYFKYEIIIDESIKNKIFNVKDIQEINDYKTKLIEKGFKRELRDFQLRNLKILSKKNIGAEFSVPGGGKTSVALSYYALLKNNKSKLLVVCPKNAMLAWDEDLPECFNSKIVNTMNYFGKEKFFRIHENKDIDINSDNFVDSNFFIITYTQLQKFESTITKFLIQNDVFLFLDESHRTKLGKEGEWGKSALKLKDFPTHKLILSGTPITKEINDLKAQAEFLYGYEMNEAVLVDEIDKIKVRTTKNELDIDPMESSKIYIDMSEEQKYVDNFFNNKIKEVQINDIDSFLKIDQLKKIVIYKLMLSSNPYLLRRRMYEEGLPEKYIPTNYGSKIYTACKIARELAVNNQKVVIWSFFRENVELIDSLLKDIGSQFIHGGVDTGDINQEGTREYIIHSFKNDDKKMVLVANPAAAGEGISLHKECHRSIYIDRTFNAAHFLQSRDRIHRLGLPKNTQVKETILVHENQIDLKVEQNLKEKLDLMENVLNDFSINPSLKILSSIVDYMTWSNEDPDIGSKSYDSMIDNHVINELIDET